MSASMQPLRDLMEKTDRVRLCGESMDLTFSVAGINAIKCDGQYNIPDGEVFTAPVKDSVNGNILFTAPSMKSGKIFTNIQLQFRLR